MSRKKSEINSVSQRNGQNHLNLHKQYADGGGGSSRCIRLKLFNDKNDTL